MLSDRATAGFSGSDLTSLAKDAALGPIRGTIILLNWTQNHILPRLSGSLEEKLRKTLLFFKDKQI